MAENKEGEAESGVDDRTLFDFCMSVLRLEYDSHLLQVYITPEISACSNEDIMKMCLKESCFEHMTWLLFTQAVVVFAVVACCHACHETSSSAYIFIYT
jgi:hypothetical protein